MTSLSIPEQDLRTTQKLIPKSTNLGFTKTQECFGIGASEIFSKYNVDTEAGWMYPRKLLDIFH